MASSKDEVNVCRDIIPYVPPIPIVKNVGTVIVPEELTERKRRLVTSKIIDKNDVIFQIVPSEGEADLYTIKLKKNKEESSDPHELNRKYYEKLHGWTAERRQRRNGVCDKFYIHESRRRACRSIGDVRRFIFQGSEKLKVKVDQETNAVSMDFGMSEDPIKERNIETLNFEEESGTQDQRSSEHPIKIKTAKENYKLDMFFADALNNSMKSSKGV
ncbi:hypothetical protein RND71_038436 [Anisodus tanguticus]|uniref:Uncharacterized protein n=1 Tax=Anisodus tanguticus TaxID=243964 RepID=A0AAE1QZM7_9SOLA|nr:hypothetical protein RND71_038436 [Anisodus tanguticus]